jgi:hypothetical protein
MSGNAKIAEASGVGYAYWTDGVGGKIPSVTVYGEYRQDGTPTPTAPIPMIPATPLITAKGKNLLPYPYYDGESKTHSGVEYKVNSDRSISAKGVLTNDSYFRLSRYVNFGDMGLYTESMFIGSDRLSYSYSPFRETSIYMKASVGSIDNTLYPQVERKKNVIDLSKAKKNLLHFSGYGDPIFDSAYLASVLKPNTNYRIGFRVTCIGDSTVASIKNAQLGIYVAGSKEGSTAAAGITTWATNGQAFNLTKTFTTPAVIDSNFVMYAFSQWGVTESGENIYNKVRFENLFIAETAGISPTEYEKSFDGGSIQAPALRAVEDVRDEWDAITGKGIRRIGEIVLTGDETNENGGNGYSGYPYNGMNGCSVYTDKYLGAYKRGLCNIGTIVRNSGSTKMHSVWIGAGNNRVYFIGIFDTLGFTNTIQFKDWVRQKYQAGDPVRIWYVLDAPEEFTTAPSRIYQPKGIGQIMQTDAGVQARIKAQYLQK